MQAEPLISAMVTSNTIKKVALSNYTDPKKERSYHLCVVGFELMPRDLLDGSPFTRAK
jgi:hypothetical protein